jgi:hypothetical protein
MGLMDILQQYTRNTGVPDATTVHNHFDEVARTAPANPAAVAFVRQANIANGPQQVNNEVDGLHKREIENRQPELLEAEHGERLDIGASRATGAANQRWNLAPRGNDA